MMFLDHEGIHTNYDPRYYQHNDRPGPIPSCHHMLNSITYYSVVVVLVVVGLVVRHHVTTSSARFRTFRTWCVPQIGSRRPLSRHGHDHDGHGGNRPDHQKQCRDANVPVVVRVGVMVMIVVAAALVSPDSHSETLVMMVLVDRTIRRWSYWPWWSEYVS